MSRPTRESAAGRAYLDLQNQARRQNRGTQELLTMYIVERWLSWMSRSYAEDFILKGGMLLASFGTRRPTVDADALARNMASDEETVARRVADIAVPIRILGCPIETVLAEKLVTAIELGRANTRVRDFADFHLLTGTQALQCRELRDALTATATFRGTTLIPLAQATEGLAALRDITYVAYRKGLGEAGTSLPERFFDTVAAASDFVDPALDGLDANALWSPVERNWNTASGAPSEPTESATGRAEL